VALQVSRASRRKIGDILLFSRRENRRMSPIFRLGGPLRRRSRGDMPERHAAQAATPRANDGAAALDMECHRTFPWPAPPAARCPEIGPLWPAVGSTLNRSTSSVSSAPQTWTPAAGCRGESLARSLSSAAAPSLGRGGHCIVRLNGRHLRRGPDGARARRDPVGTFSLWTKAQRENVPTGSRSARDRERARDSTRHPAAGCNPVCRD